MGSFSDTNMLLISLFFYAWQLKMSLLANGGAFTATLIKTPHPRKHCSLQNPPIPLTVSYPGPGVSEESSHPATASKQRSRRDSLPCISIRSASNESQTNEKLSSAPVFKLLASCISV